MTDFLFVSTLMRSPGGIVTGITDLTVIPQASAPMVYALNRSAEILSRYSLGTDGTLGTEDDTGLGVEIAQVEMVDLGGAAHLVTIGPGLADQLMFPIGPDGALATPLSIPTGATGFGGFADVAGITIGGVPYLYGVGYTNGHVYGYQLDTNPTGNIAANAPPPILAGISRVNTAEVAGAPVLLTVATDGSSISSHRIDGGGTITTADTTGAVDGLGVAGVAEIRHVTLPDGDYLVVAARDSSSLSVLAIDAAGQLSPVDHIVDDLHSRFQFASDLEVITLSDRVVLAAAGADAGVSLFELLPGGRLHHIDTVLDDGDRSLQGVGALALAERNGLLNLHVGSLTETGISHFQADTSSWTTPWIGTGGDDTVLGSSGSELFWGRAGDDTLNASGGADILMDGAGSDVLIGGAGADVFVLAADGRSDSISDYNALVDVIDLTGWQFLRGAAQIGFTATATGARISYQDETLEITAHDSQTLTAEEVLKPQSFNLSRFPVGNPSDGTDIIGTPAADILEGGTENNVLEGLAGDDTLRGGAGDDALIGGAGADVLEGGFGADTVRYSDALAAIVADLGFPGGNTGDASGDTYLEVEHLEGTGFADNLRGDAGDNRIKGAGGADTVIAREGDDTLLGDDGDDILVGGTGADWIDGGAGRDRAAYWQATGGLRVDLLVASTNSGEAAGDLYTAVEDLQGTGFDDTLLGNNANNQLFGGAGADEMHGRGGDDTLVGGDGADVMLGGAGADALDGGGGLDRAAYWTTSSAITVDLQSPQINTGDAAGDSFQSIEELLGTPYNDNLRGDGAANGIWGGDGRDVIYGRNGDDTLYGQDGGDVFIGGLGADRMVGGVGIDRAAYWNATTGVTADLIAAGLNTGEAAGDVVISVENLHGGDFDDDLRGQNGPNRLWGGLGNDTLIGRGGNDYFLGEQGNDTMLPGVGADTMDGGTGTDQVSYRTSKSGLTVDLGNPGNNTGDAAGNVYISVEDLQGSNHNDQLFGDAGGNIILGGAGDDTIHGRSGDDTLFGDGGADAFVFASGTDRVEDFVLGADGLSFDLGTAQTDADILALAVSSNGGTLFDFGAGASLFVAGLDPSTLSLGDITVL